MAQVAWRRRGVVAAFSGLLALFASAAGAIEVDVEFHNSIDLSVCRNWTWASGGQPAANYQVEAALRGEIEAQLAKKGATRREEGAGCLVATASRRDVIFPAGTLAIEIYDVASQRLAWSAVAAAIITDDEPKKVAKIARKAVKQAFKKFPKI